MAVNKIGFKSDTPEKKDKLGPLHQENFATISLPRMTEVTDKRSNFVMFGGDNQYPTFLRMLYDSSALHRTYCNKKIREAFANGLTYDKTEDNYFLNVANKSGETWNDVFFKCLSDYVIFGGFCLNPVWDAAGERVISIQHVDFTRVRSGIYNADLEVHQYFLSFDWNRTREYPWKVFTKYDPDVAREAAKAGLTDNLSQIFYCSEPSSGRIYYPLPDYIGAANDIQIDIAVGRFHLANLENGLLPSMHVALIGDFTDEEKQKMYEELRGKMTGSFNGGRMIITNARDKDSVAIITPLTLANDSYYLEIEKRIGQRIAMAHGITSPLLVGDRSVSGGLGNNADELQTAWLYFTKETIEKIRLLPIRIFNQLSTASGYDGILSVIPTQLFTNSQIQEVSKNTNQNDTVSTPNSGNNTNPTT